MVLLEVLHIIKMVNSMSYITKSGFNFDGYPNYSDKSITQPGQTINLDEVVKRLARGEKVSMYDSYSDKNADFDTLVLNRNDLKSMTNEQVERLVEASRASKEIDSGSVESPVEKNPAAND